MIAAIILAAAYATGGVGIWLMGPLREFDYGGWRDVGTVRRLFACVIWPITLLQMWDPS